MRIASGVGVLVVVAWAGSAGAQEVREVPYQRDQVVRVNTGLGIATQIEISAQEQVKDFGTGFSDGWELVRRDNIFYIRPKNVDVDTNMYIRTNMRSYLLDLRVSATKWKTLEEAKNAGVFYKIRFVYGNEEPDKASPLAAANAVMHAEAVGLASGVAGRALRFAVDLVIVLILVIGGRITPAFTQNALRRRGVERSVRSWPWIGALAIGSAGALAVATAVLGRTQLTGLLAALAGLAAAVRLYGWQTWHIRSDPLLWSLHAGTAWVGVGLLLVGASDLGAAVPAAAGLHALTAGAMGSTILAVMTRVGLGHTGRPLVLPRGVVWSYALVQVAAVCRVAAPFLPGEGQRELLLASGLAWAVAFGLFAVRYWPILTTPRPDGRPG